MIGFKTKYCQKRAIILNINTMYNVFIVLMWYCKTFVLLLKWDMGKVRDRSTV